MRYLPLLLALGLLSGPAHAQDFFVEQSAPAHGAASVSAIDTVAFSFNQEVEVSTDWNTTFVSEPSGSLQINGVALCLNFQGACGGGDDVPRHVRFQVTHQSDTDYTWLIYAVQSAGGTSMTEPYVLRYTTAQESGQGEVSGSVSSPVPASPSLSSARTSAARTTLRAIADGLKRRDRGHPVFEQPNRSPATSNNLTSPPQRPGAHVKTVGRKAAGTGPFTQILLVEDFSVEEDDWTIRAADVLLGSSGPYALDFVRAGTYVPLAVRYTDGTNAEIDALGFHDPDGDGTPNTIEVEANNQTGIDLQLYNFPRTTARAESTLPVAVDSAAQYAPDQELRWILAETGMQPDGSAHAWTYRFYAPSNNLATEVTVDPLSVEIDTSSTPGLLTEMNPIPDDFIDSDEALQIALNDGGQEFVDSYPPRNLTTLLSGGNLFWTDAPIPSEEFWQVRLIGTTSSTVETFERYIDIETGDFLPVELTRLVALKDESAVKLRWATASETNNAGFEVQHAVGDSTSDAPWTELGFVTGAGTTQEAQQYQFRVEALDAGLHRFRLKQVDLDGTTQLSDVIFTELGLETPLRLPPPSPNPVRQTATVHFGAREAEEGTVAMYDMLGRRVATLYEGSLSNGQLHSVRVNANRLPSGVYFVRLTAGDHVRTRKLTIIE